MSKLINLNGNVVNKYKKSKSLLSFLAACRFSVKAGPSGECKSLNQNVNSLNVNELICNLIGHQACRPDSHSALDRSHRLVNG